LATYQILISANINSQNFLEKFFRNFFRNITFKKIEKWQNILSNNEGKSAASFCRQVAAWLPDKFCNFYLVKNHKIGKNSRIAIAIEKISIDLESLEF
jgi:hypothetical protein